MEFGERLTEVPRRERLSWQSKIYTTEIAPSHTIFIRIHLQQQPPISLLNCTERWLCGFSFANCFGERLPAEFHATLDAITISQHTMNPSFGVIPNEDVLM